MSTACEGWCPSPLPSPPNPSPGLKRVRYPFHCCQVNRVSERVFRSPDRRWFRSDDLPRHKRVPWPLHHGVYSKRSRDHFSKTNMYLFVNNLFIPLQISIFVWKDQKKKKKKKKKPCNFIRLPIIRSLVEVQLKQWNLY